MKLFDFRLAFLKKFNYNYKGNNGAFKEEDGAFMELNCYGRLGLLLLGLGLGSVSALGIANFEQKMPGYHESLGVDGARRDYDFNVINYKSNAPGNVFFAGETPELTVQVRNTSDKELAINGVWRFIRWNSRQIPGDFWSATMTRERVVEEIPVQCKIAPKGYVDVVLKPALPAEFGGYALILDAGKAAGARFVTSICRVPKTESAAVQFPLQSGEFFEPAAMARVGLQAIRFGIPYDPSGTKERERTEQQLEKVFAEMKKNNVVATIEIGAGGSGYVMDVVRPHLDANNVMMQTKSDYVWHPKYDEDYRKFLYDIMVKYGWPKGPVNGIMLWNEPWEGISISGWGADMLRYRELYKIMGEATRQAEKDGNVRVLVGGCDSSSNTLDKLFPDGSQEFMKYFDFCSIHYQGLSSPSLYRDWINRSGGRVLIWDTESWVGNADDVLATTIAANRAAGYDRSMGFFNGYAFGNNPHHGRGNKTERILTEKGEQTVELPLIAYPMAAAVAATQHYIGNRLFEKVMIQDGLPWLFEFKGLDEEESPSFLKRWFGKASEDRTIVLSGDLSRIFGDRAPYSRQVALSEVKAKKQWRAHVAAMRPGTPEWKAAFDELRRRMPHLKLNDGNLLANWEEAFRQTWMPEGVYFEFSADPSYGVYDIYGNEVKPQGALYRLGLDSGSWFLRSKEPGGFAKLAKAAVAGQLYGIVPTELIPHDFLAPVVPGSVLKLEAHNMLNRTLKGKLDISIGALKLEYPAELNLGPFERREVLVKIVGGNADPENFYRASFRYDAGKDGMAEAEDTMRVNRIAKRTIEVDGKFDDWKDVLPQRALSSDNAARTQMEAAWLPFDKVTDFKRGGQAEVRFAADDEYFYVAAQITDTVQDKGTLRFATADWDEFFYPEVSRDYVKDKTFVFEVQNEDAAAARVESPDGKRLAGTIRSKIDRIRYDLELPTEKLTTVTAYIPYADFRSGRLCSVRMMDSATGRELAGRQVWNVNTGAFVSFAAAGKVSLEVVNLRPWHRESGRIAGLFFDEYTDTKVKRNTKNAAQASFLGLDENKPGLWRGRFGKLGYILPGADIAKVEPGIAFKLRNDETFREHKWPADVRRFSYRKRPILPDGASSGKAGFQLAFNSIPADQDKVMLATLPGTPFGFINYRSSDRQFALNRVAPEYGGGTEIWRLEAPEAPRKHFYPRQPKAPWEGAAEGGKLVINYEGNMRLIEAAIPWSEMPEVKALRDAGKPVKLSFRANREGAASIEFGDGRAATRPGGMTFSPDWKQSYTNEIEFSFEK